MKSLACTLALLAAFLALPVCAQTTPVAPTSTDPANLYAVGMSYSQGAVPSIAGTGMYARKVSDVGTYAFTVMDALPASSKPFTVSTNMGVGVAQKVTTIGKVPIFIPVSAGFTYTGTNAGWNWTGGALADFKVKDGYHIMPNVRFVKSSVTGTTTYQPIFGIWFGFGQ